MSIIIVLKTEDRHHLLTIGLSAGGPDFLHSPEATEKKTLRFAVIGIVLLVRSRHGQIFHHANPAVRTFCGELSVSQHLEIAFVPQPRWVQVYSIRERIAAEEC